MSEPDEGSPPRARMPLTRGFLFADLRGYTDFVQRQGDDAARDLLRTYRSMVRSVIGRFDGAEIRTEGDSFYVVFPSASGAVLCALEIIDQAAHQEGQPIQVGIGVHAGESVEDTEGYIGLAVNIAARICAEARAGEVLVSDTVRSLTRGASELTFTPRGRRQLKGVNEPVSLYAVSDGRSVVAPGVGPGRANRRRLALGLVVGGLAIVVVAGLVVLRPGSSRGGADATASPSAVAVDRTAGASPTIAPVPSPSGPIPLPISDGLAPHVTAAPGSYRTVSFKPALGLRLSTGWEALSDEPDVVELSRQTSKRGQPEGQLTFSRSRVGFAGPCSTDKTIRIGEGTGAVLDWLEGLDFITYRDPTPVVVGGASGVRLDGVVDAAPPPCPKAPADQPDWYALLNDSRGTAFLVPGTNVSLTVLDVDGESVLLVVEESTTADPSFDHEVEAVLLTVAFD